MAFVGDIAFRFLKYIQTCENPSMLESHVTVSDINDHMLKVGEQRALANGITSGWCLL